MLSLGVLLLNYNAQKFNRRKFIAGALALPSSHIFNEQDGRSIHLNEHYFQKIILIQNILHGFGNFNMMAT